MLLDLENDSSSSKDDNKDNANYKLNETYNNSYVLVPSLACDLEERLV